MHQRIADVSTSKFRELNFRQKKNSIRLILLTNEIQIDFQLFKSKKKKISKINNFEDII